MRRTLAVTLTICALTAAGQPAGGPVERVTPSAELGGRHLVPLLSSGGGLELAAPSHRGEPLATALWRWQGGKASRIAELPGLRANQLRELKGDGRGRRLFLGGGVTLPGARQGEVYGWQVVELSPDRPPRTVWQSRDVAGLPAGDEPFVAVDAEGSRWAGLVRRYQAGQLIGGRLLVGELPNTTSSLEYEFSVERDTPAAYDPEAPWFVVFGAATRLLVVAEGLPIILDLGVDDVRRTPLAVPSPPARAAHFHQASGTVWLSDDGETHHGYVLPPHRPAPHAAPLSPTLHLGVDEVGFARGRILGSVPEGLAIYGVRGGRRLVAFVRVDGQHRPATVRAVALPGGVQAQYVWLSPDGATLVWAELATGAALAPVLHRAAVASLESVR